jgi:hypothetical protein
VLKGSFWSNETDPRDAPPARVGASMDFDPNFGATLLFGGRTGSDLFNDTWAFVGGIWTNVSYLSGAPSPREGAGLAFDPQPGVNGSVLFGGCVPSFGLACTNDTWVWRGWGGWVQLFPSFAPPAVGFAAMAYDAADGYVVLFGGAAGLGGTSSETWEFYSGQWWVVHPTSSPGARGFTSMVYVPGLSGVLLFGGLNVTIGDTNDTWLFSDGEWSGISPTTSPSPRDAIGLALDGSGTTPILVGGENLTTDVAFNDTWAYEVPPSVGLSENLSSAEVSQPVQFTLQIDGGTAPYAATVDFGDSSSASLTANGSALVVDHAYSTPGNYTVTAALSDRLGVPFAGNALLLTVVPGPSVMAEVTPSAGDIGTTFVFRSTVTSPGTPPLSYTLSFGDGQVGSGSNASYSYSAAGSYGVVLNVTDSVGAMTSSTVHVTVAPAPSVTLSVLPAAPVAGTDVGFVATVAGGTGPFTYAWRFGDGGSSDAAAPEHNYSYGGTFPVEVWVNDSAGGSAHATSSLVVSGAGAPTPNAVASVPLWFWLALAALVVAGVLVVVLLTRRRGSDPPPN